MTHSIMALVRRGCALLNSWQIQEREGQASVTHADEDVIMRVWCVRLNEHMQMSAAAMLACKGSCVVCVRCASNTQHALSPWKASFSSVERGWMVPTRPQRARVQVWYVRVMYKRKARACDLRAPPQAHSRGVFVCTLRGTPFHTTPSHSHQFPISTPLFPIAALVNGRISPRLNFLPIIPLIVYLAVQLASPAYRTHMPNVIPHSLHRSGSCLSKRIRY